MGSEGFRGGSEPPAPRPTARAGSGKRPVPGAFWRFPSWSAGGVPGGPGGSAPSRHVPIRRDIQRYIAIYRNRPRQRPPSGAYARRDSMAATILRSLESLSTNPSPFWGGPAALRAGDAPKTGQGGKGDTPKMPPPRGGGTRWGRGTHLFGVDQVSPHCHLKPSRHLRGALAALGGHGGQLRENPPKYRGSPQNPLPPHTRIRRPSPKSCSP